MFPELLGWSLVVSMGTMFLVWLVSLMLKNASIVDSFWGPGFIVQAALLPLLAGGFTGQSWLVLGMVAAWGLRLAAHVSVRNHGKGEDWRYRAWREAAGASFWWRSYFKVFLPQGLILVVVALPILATALNTVPAAWSFLHGVGVAIWLFGLCFEALGDWQLLRFKRNPDNQGKVMDRGLWRTTRHPNYFGEAVLWWGIWLTSFSAPWGIAAVIGPATITFLLLRVSGVRLLERELKTRSPEYVDYIRRTSPFIPWFPKT